MKNKENLEKEKSDKDYLRKEREEHSNRMITDSEKLNETIRDLTAR
jgi:hypothetical protein